MNLQTVIKILFSLIIIGFCLFEFILQRQNKIFQEVQIALFQTQWPLMVCAAVWCCTFLFLTFSPNDLPLIGLFLVAIAMYFFYAASSSATDALTLVAGVTMGRGAAVLFGIGNPKSHISNYLIGLIGLLAFSVWWHVDTTNNPYHGPRWMGLWNNPNIYGMLMGAGGVLAIGLRATNLKSETGNLKSENFGGNKPVRGSWNSSLRIFLFIAAGMMAVGLVMSYSRGAMLATSAGLLYLAWSYGKIKWRYVVIGGGCVALGVGLLWGRTGDDVPWYLKRLDFSRPSAQHRVSAWRGAVQMMRDHPLGVGWNQAVTTYDKNYSPPVGGAAALTMNSYLMLGTELGLPGLLCFVAYVGLALKTENRKQKAETLQQIGNRKADGGKHLHLTPALSPFGSQESALSAQPSSDLR